MRFVTKQFGEKIPEQTGDRLGLEYLPKVALLRSSAADYAVGDGAATASAIATGTRTNLRAVAIDPAGRMRTTLVDLARVEGRSTGLTSGGSSRTPKPGRST